jgi:two-component system invasion response regulator UvrY
MTTTTTDLSLERVRAVPQTRRDVMAWSSDSAGAHRGTVRVLCVDDHAMLLEGLKAALAARPDGESITLIGGLSSAEKLFDAVQQSNPDVVMLDIEMPGPDVFEAADRLRHQRPELKVVFLSGHVRDGYIASAYNCGASGYFSKSDELSDIVQGLRDVSRAPTGAFIMSPRVRERVRPAGDGGFARPGGPPVAAPATPLSQLTAREVEVLRLIGKGLSRTQIAAELSRSPKTIDGHQDRMMKKLGIATRADLLRFAIREGLAEA